MEYENGNKESKKYKDKKYDDEESDSDDDDSDSEKNYKVKQKYKDKERDHKYRDKKDYRDYEKSKNYRDHERSHRDRDIERSHRDKPRRYRNHHKERDKPHRSKNHSVSRSPKHHRSRSRSRSKHHSRSKSPSRRRSRSGSRHRSRARHSPPYKRKYDDKRYESSGFGSRSGKDGSDSSFPPNKGQRKMMILEKLGIDLVVPGNMDKSQTGTSQSMSNAGQKGLISGELAAYCNITPANSKQIMERLNRKKLLWQNKSTEQKATPENKDAAATAAAKPNTMWQSAIFTKDGDSKQTAKFKRLMGIKVDGETASETSEPNTSVASEKDLIKRQEEMFQNMEMQYEVARASTHTHRGIGLGFGIHQYPR